MGSNKVLHSIAAGKVFPCSFTCDGRPGRMTEPSVRVHWELNRFADFPALDWVLHFENTGAAPTRIVQDIRVLDLTLDAPPYRLHRLNGAPANPSDFEPRAAKISAGQVEELSAGDGRSSNRDFPFFTIETGDGPLVVAVGWSSQWAARLQALDDRRLRITAGMERTHFRLLPGEKVRSPRILLFFGEPAQFRELIYQHYADKRLPALFCNTCFTRRGEWLNECNADNQISLINAFAPLGLEGLITDAGWFEGGWPNGAGNWTPRRDAYPDGMAPVAAAAKKRGMVYGLWFEPERVVAGTGLHREHPEWVLTDGTPGQKTLLANFGLREVQDYFFNVVESFMEMPGFGFYRQDFNMSPLAYWRHHDAPDRQGITEIRYIEGLYAFWERLADRWPTALRESCASGGRRIDLEAIRRMPLHQKSDYWFDNEVDQASLWSLSQYLPNNLITVPLTRLDDYSFHSTLAASLVPSWIADAPDFDAARARHLLSRYRQVRRLLVGQWYPLTPYSRDSRQWLASQYHRPDLQEGMILAFRRLQCETHELRVALRGMDANADYELVADKTWSATGAQLMESVHVPLANKPRSGLITYRRI
jgi:alpha-galactosidase